MSTSSSTKEEEIEDQAQEGWKSTLSARGLSTVACAVRFNRYPGCQTFSHAVSGFGQVLKSDPREKPLDQSAIPLIAPSQLQPRLYQNIQNLDVLLIGSLEISNVSNALIGLQSQ